MEDIQVDYIYSGVLVDVKTRRQFWRFSGSLLDEYRVRIVVLSDHFSGQVIVLLFSCDFDNTCLQDDRHVGSIEQFDWVFSLLSSVLGITDWKIHSPSWKTIDSEGKWSEMDDEKRGRWEKIGTRTMKGKKLSWESNGGDRGESAESEERSENVRGKGEKKESESSWYTLLKNNSEHMQSDTLTQSHTYVPWKKMTMRKMRTVARRLVRLGRFDL